MKRSTRTSTKSSSTNSLHRFASGWWFVVRGWWIIAVILSACSDDPTGPSTEFIVSAFPESVDQGQVCTLYVSHSVNGNAPITAELRSSVVERLLVERGYQDRTPIAIVHLSDTSRSGMLTFTVDGQTLPGTHVRVYGKDRTVNTPMVLGSPLPVLVAGGRYKDSDTLYEILTNGVRSPLPKPQPFDGQYRSSYRTSPQTVELYDSSTELYHRITPSITWSTPKAVVITTGTPSQRVTSITLQNVDLNGEGEKHWRIRIRSNMLDTIITESGLVLQNLNVPSIHIDIELNGLRFDLGDHSINSNGDPLSFHGTLAFEHTAQLEVHYRGGSITQSGTTVSDSGTKVLYGHQQTSYPTVRFSGDSILFSEGMRITGWIILDGTRATVSYQELIYDDLRTRVATYQFAASDVVVSELTGQSLTLTSQNKDFVALKQLRYQIDYYEGHHTISYFYQEFLLRQLNPLDADFSLTIRWTP